MSQIFIDCLKVFMNTALSLLNCFKLPGTNFTPLVAIIGSTIVILSIKILKNIGGSYDV